MNKIGNSNVQNFQTSRYSNMASVKRNKKSKTDDNVSKKWKEPSAEGTVNMTEEVEINSSEQVCGNQLLNY